MTSQPAQQPPGGRLRMLRTMAFAFLSGTILIGAVGVFLADPLAEQTIWIIATPAVVGVVAGVACAFLRPTMLRPVAADAVAPEREGAARFQSAFFLSVACAELPVMASILLTVAFDGSMLVPVVGAIVTVILLVLYVWPSTSTVRTAQQRLDAAGARTRLEEQLAA